jgi:hypothetical protein
VTLNPEESKQNGAAPKTGDAPAEEKKGKLFPELEELQQEIDRRIRDNKRFLERFLDEDFNEDDEESEAAEDEGEDFEEL